MSNSHEALAARMTDGVTVCDLERDDHHNAVDVVIRQNGTMTIKQTFYGASEVVALSADGVHRLVEAVTAHTKAARQADAEAFIAELSQPTKEPTEVVRERLLAAGYDRELVAKMFADVIADASTMGSLDGAARDSLYLDTLAWCFQYAPDGREEDLLEKAHVRACRRLGRDADLHFAEWSARTFGRTAPDGPRS